jgi:hypothetical protein
MAVWHLVSIVISTGIEDWKAIGGSAQTTSVTRF